MEFENYSDYICYDIDSYYHEHPYGPDRCPMCGSDLSKLEIEPSRAMRNEIGRDVSGWPLDSNASFRYTCNECHWWCIRDACVFIGLDADYRRESSDYLIFAVAGKNESKVFKGTLEDTQPWLNALDDPDIQDRDVVRYLPKELAALIYKPSNSTEGKPIRPRGIDDLSKYDPFIIRARDYMAKKREEKLYKTEPIRLSPGDKVCITDQTLGHSGRALSVVTKGNLGTVISYDDLRKLWSEYDLRQAKKWTDDGIHYPIRLETDIPPSEDECAFWNTLRWHPWLHGISECVNKNAWKVLMMDVNCLEKITDP